jgi:hypothetical protein
MAKVPWGEALAGLLIPKIQWNGAFLTTLVTCGAAILVQGISRRWRRRSRPLLLRHAIEARQQCQFCRLRAAPQFDDQSGSREHRVGRLDRINAAQTIAT